MRVTGKKTVYEGRYLRIVEKTVTTRDGKTHPWEAVERTNVHGSGAVVIVALTKGGDLLFEKNWRSALESFLPVPECDCGPGLLSDCHLSSERAQAAQGGT